MAELADALDSGSNGRKAVQVQVLLPAPSLKALYVKALGFFIGKGKTITTKKQVHNFRLCICHFFTWFLSQYHNDYALQHVSSA